MKHMRANGFTLVELLIVVAIIAIISAIAYPAYQDSVRKANRAEAMDTLLDTAQRLERCYTSFGSYNHANCPAAIANAATLTTSRGMYTVTVTSAAGTYSLTAVPVAGTLQASDGQCASFTIDNTGRKTAMDDSSSPSPNCW